MESLLYDEFTPNKINCGLRRVGLDIQKLAKSAFLQKGSYFVAGGGESALDSRGLTRRTFSLGGGGMVKVETSAGKEATCA
ncbi:hypothetical protein TNCT_713971 [Trichonephila clavata]|uniref:Uncharacterized protein n=1 Tax=Trichonephila clavata TaxID=2740835 RepID=A0A8X6LHU4_TRICU|nr:hypothetical protein TNCT_713971 [Trichonephila clavata]